MYIEQISLTNFKNYEAATLAFSPQVNGFVGRNGMGKTNILDAIYYLCMSKSHFLSLDADVIRVGADFFRLDGRFIRNAASERIVAKMAARKKKVLTRNEVPYKTLAEHIGLFPVIMFTPDDTLLAKEGSEERRRFLDTVLCQIDRPYLQNLSQYNKILQQRNALLKKWGDTEGGDFAETAVLLEVYDAQLVPLAAYIYAQRQAFITELSPVFNAFYAKISGAEEPVQLVYASPLHDQTMAALLVKNRDKDRILQRTSGGIHRDDLVFEMHDRSLKRFGSQGQLKSFVLSLKLAQYALLKAQNAVPPILLLDDIFDKLDEKRVENLLDLLVSERFGQIFITDTHPERMAQVLQTLAADARLFTVSRGTVAPWPLS